MYTAAVLARLLFGAVLAFLLAQVLLRKQLLLRLRWVLSSVGMRLAAAELLLGSKHLLEQNSYASSEACT